MSSSKFKGKIVALLFLVGSALLAVGLIGYLNLQNIKRDMDILYFGSLIPLNELNDITDTYHNQLESTVYQWKSGLISDQEAARKLTDALYRIDQHWNNYLSHYKRPDEVSYVAYTKTQIERMGEYFLRVRSLILHPTPEGTISLVTLSENISRIHDTIHRLIDYENEAAKYEHALLKHHYDNALMQLVLFLIVVLIFIIGMGWKIFSRIESQQRQLVASSETLQHLNAKLELASYTDSLTSLYNRRYFNLTYEREFKRAIREEKPLVFMMLDVDFFKQYNDTYGHIQGDQALQLVAKVLKSSLQRPGDFPFRLGGEEFGIILTDADSKSAQIIGEKIRSGVEALSIEHKSSQVSKILSVSIGGVCMVPTAFTTDEDMIHAADTNLYAAKKRGRNQVVFSEKL